METPSWLVALASLLPTPGVTAPDPAPAKVEQTALPKPVRFVIPIDPGGHGTRLDKVSLFVSRDGGKSWKLAGTIAVEKKHFIFGAPANGTYDFACQALMKDGRRIPEGEFGLVSAKTVVVRGGRIVSPQVHSREHVRKQDPPSIRGEIDALKKRVESLEKSQSTGAASALSPE